MKDSKVGKGVAAAAGAVGSFFGMGGPDKPMSPEDKMAKLDAEIAETKEDIKSAWTDSGRKEEEEKLKALEKQKAEMKAANKKQAAAAVPVAASGPNAQVAGAQALGDAAVMQSGGGGGTEDALASIVEQNAATSKAIVQALAKIDAKTGGGGSGIPMMIPGGNQGGQGGLGRKTVIGAPIS